MYMYISVRVNCVYRLQNNTINNHFYYQVSNHNTTCTLYMAYCNRTTCTCTCTTVTTVALF